jgi:hypothetical protein
MDLACAQPIHAGALAAHTVPQIARPASYTGNLQITPVLPGPGPSSLVNGPARRDSAYEPAGRAEEPIAGPPEKTPGRTREAREAQRRPQHLIRAMPAEGNRYAGPLRAHQLLPTAVDWHTAIRSGPAPAPPAAPRSKWLTPPARRGLSASRTIPDTPRIGRSSCDRLDPKTRRPPFRFGDLSRQEHSAPGRGDHSLCS